MKIKTESIIQAALKIGLENAEVQDLFSKSIADAEYIGEAWKGSAATAAVSAYKAFAERNGKFFNDALNEYVTFLQTVAGSYEKAEDNTTKLSDQI